MSFGTLDQKHDTAISVSKKKSGKYRILQVLRATNDHKEKMGTTQIELLHSTVIPPKYQMMIPDIKDCLFQILLIPQDRSGFAFTVWRLL